jgi:hypothetical protein
MIEFLLAASFFIMPLLIGAMSVGMNLLMATQVTEFNDDSGNEYAQGIDFSQASNQQLLVSLSSGLNFSLSGGTGVEIFSTLLKVGTADCQNGGVANPTTANCPNLGQIVVTQRLVVGNSSLYTSAYGNPTGMNASGNLLPSYYLFNSGAQANSFSSVITMASSQVAYLTETYFSSTAYNIPGLVTNSAVYAKAIY